MDDQALLELAGSRVFERGRRYYDEGRVVLSGADAGGCRALVHGTERYRVSLREAGGEFDWHCDCPAAEDGSLCKHLVSAALAWRAGDDDGEPSARTGDALRDRLSALPRETLAQWLHEAALDDPDAVLELTERALKHLLKLLERSDDSAGALQDRIAEFARLHSHSAARAEVDGQRFARALHRLKQWDQWEFLPLTAYWDALGERGRSAYRSRVEKEYAALSVVAAGRQPPTSEDWYESFPILRRREELAHCESDCDALIEVYSRDLGSGYAYQRLVDVCLEYGREAEATRWAARGVRDQPDWPGLRERLAQRYLADSLVQSSTGGKACPLSWNRSA